MEAVPGLKTEQFFGAAHVETTARLTVRFAYVPSDSPCATDLFRDELRQVFEC
jgi:hypothetical protein